MAQPAPRSLIELLARPHDHGQGDDRETPRDPIQVEHPSLPRDPVPQRNRERHQQMTQEVDLLHGAVVAHWPVGHQQHGPEHREHRDDGGDHELPGEGADFAAARDPFALERIFRGNRRRNLEARRTDRLLEIFRTHDAGDVVDGRGFRRLVGDRANDAVDPGERPFERRDARGIVQIDDAERDAGLAAVVARIAHRLDELCDIGLAGVVFDRGLVGGEVDARRGDTGGTGERFLHRRGAAGAGHAFDGQDDPRFTHACRRGTCAATMPRAARLRVQPRATPSACSCRSGRGTRPVGRG